MSLYFDYRVQTPDPAAIQIDIAWHNQYPLLTVTSFDQESGGSLTIYDELVCIIMDLFHPRNAKIQITCTENSCSGGTSTRPGFSKKPHFESDISRLAPRAPTSCRRLGKRRLFHLEWWHRICLGPFAPS